MRRLAPITLLALMLAVLSPGIATADVQVGTAVGPDFLVDPNTSLATVSGELSCTEPARATVTGTLTQRRTVISAVRLQCGQVPATPFTLIFSGFLPGPATFQISATACDLDTGVCDTSASATFRIELTSAA
ncbi:MAG TPA: hypothetical protein VGR41_01940 [Actinomycetota bacterium]|nr:hypothetical protein [Actinomycetota bacterium]